MNPVDIYSYYGVESGKPLVLIGQSKERFLAHHGVKGQKWGVRNGPPYPLKSVSDISKTKSKVITGHESTPKIAEPNSVIDKQDASGKVVTRTIYDANGKKRTDINTTNHGNPKEHPYGEHGEHAHDYVWNDDMSRSEKTIRELTDKEREDNKDIL